MLNDLDDLAMSEVGGTLPISREHVNVRALAEAAATELTPGFCVVTVSNEGEPIPEDAVPLLFQPFRRGPGASGVRNMGLGLFIVQQIASAHGGAVDVRSAPEGTASAFPCKSP